MSESPVLTREPAARDVEEDEQLQKVAEMLANQPPMNTGSRLRIGMIMPSVNYVADPQIQTMLPENIQLHTTRIKLVGQSEEDLQKMLDELDNCASLLADARPQRILFHCTAASMLSPEMGGEICKQITDLTGIPATDTADAVISAFETLGAKKIVLVSPYHPSVNEHEIEFFSHFGIEVLKDHALGLEGSQFGEVKPIEWYKVVLENRHPDADAYFISCAGARATEVISSMEEALGKPVVTSNSAVTWRCLRQSGVNDRITEYGQLFSH